VNTRGKLYTPYYYIFEKYLGRWSRTGRKGEDAEGEEDVGGGAKQGNFIIGQSEESASFVAKFLEDSFRTGVVLPLP